MTATGSELEKFVHDLARNLDDERGPLLVALHAVQEQYGYVDDQAVRLLADAFNLSRADVHGVVSFYTDFRTTPPGALTVKVCRAEACASVGAESLLGALRATLQVEVGGTTSDGSTTLDQVFCLGNCALGPAVEVGGKVHGRVDPARALALIAQERNS